MSTLSLSRLRQQLRIYQQNRHTRRQLLSLDAHLLADIGKTPAQVREEAAKPFWKARSSTAKIG